MPPCAQPGYTYNSTTSTGICDCVVGPMLANGTCYFDGPAVVDLQVAMAGYGPSGKREWDLEFFLKGTCANSHLPSSLRPLISLLLFLSTASSF